MKLNILLPTDFSDNSWSAIVYALKLYEETECTFYLLNSTATHVSTMSNLSNKLLEIMTANAMKELVELKKQIVISDANSNHDFEILLSSQNLTQAIKSSIIKNQINLIVMGTKGATGTKEMFFGSNTVKTLKKIKGCPILIVPDEYDFRVPRQIAFPTDYKRFFGEKELRPIKELSQLYNSKIRVLHINKEETLDDIQEYNYTKLNEYLENHEHSFHWMPDYSSKEIEIKEFIEDLEIDILAMVNYKHSCLEKITKEPVIKKIGFRPIIPFLVVPS